MGSFGNCKRSIGNGSPGLLCNDLGKETEKRTIVHRMAGEASLERDFEAMSLSKRLIKSVSLKLRKKNYRIDSEEEGNERRISSRCLGLYGTGGGCKISAETCEDFGDGINNRRSSVHEEDKGYLATCGNEETRIDCFSYGVAERFCIRNNKKEGDLKEPPQSSRMDIWIPDDLLEMCLMRLPLTTLMTARLVCKKWRYLTTTPRFMQLRCKNMHETPWLFLFGMVKDGYCIGQINALDVSLDKWHRIDADVLRGRFLFSVASIRDDVYIVGGCSSLSNFGKVDKSSFKTHKGVLEFSPLTRSWRKVTPMKYARSSPILGVFEVNSDCSIFSRHQDRQSWRFPRTRVGGVSDVYEDPHRLSLRRQIGESFDESEAPLESKRKPYGFVKEQNNHSKNGMRFVLIVVGGLGSWDEPLDSGEIYDPLSNKWMDIMKLPEDFGVVCSGVVCNRMFYVYSKTDKLAAYDLERSAWFVIQTVHLPPRLREYDPKLISCEGRVLMLSVSWCEQDGIISRREKAIRKLWELDLVLFTWTEISRHPDAPMDWNAAFVSDRNRIFGVEMFKIFGQVLDFLTVCDMSDSGLKWDRISRKHVAHELDASSCITKSIAVLHL